VSAIDVLQEIEWSGEGNVCPACGAWGPSSRTNGIHRPACTLAAALREPDAVRGKGSTPVIVRAKCGGDACGGAGQVRYFVRREHVQYPDDFSCERCKGEWEGRRLEAVDIATEIERLTALLATRDREAERDARRIVRAETAAKELAEPSRELVEALYRLRVTLATREQRAAFRAVERIVHRTPARAASVGKRHG
jgi:hypothetical protein